MRRACTYRVHCKKGQLPDDTVLENVLDRKFEQPKPRTAFVTDVTYIPVKEGWLYVSPVIDLCTREVVVCEMSICQDLNLALKTLRKLNKIFDGPAMLHNDQGALYTSIALRKEAQKHEIAQSYSRKGNCWDNAVMENWDGMLKTEWLYHPSFRRDKKILSTKQAMKEIRAYCRYYNTKRIQAKLGYRTPLKFREAIA